MLNLVFALTLLNPTLSTANGTHKNENGNRRFTRIKVIDVLRIQVAERIKTGSSEWLQLDSKDVVAKTRARHSLNSFMRLAECWVSIDSDAVVDLVIEIDNKKKIKSSRIQIPGKKSEILVKSRFSDFEYRLKFSIIPVSRDNTIEHPEETVKLNYSIEVVNNKELIFKEYFVPKCAFQVFAKGDTVIQPRPFEWKGKGVVQIKR